MRRIAGVLVLVLGTGALGWYATENSARQMEADIADRAADTGLVENAIHEITTDVSGRDIIVSGMADNADEKAAILASLNDLTGRRVVRDEMTVIESVDPYLFTTTKSDIGLTHTGYVPSEAARVDLAQALGAEDLTNVEIANGAPTGFASVVTRAPEALAPLVSGEMSLEGIVVTLSGTAMSVADRDAALAALTDLPEGFVANSAIELLDDGSAFRLSVDKAGTAATGKIPTGFEAASIVAIDGAGSLDGVETSPLEDAEWSGIARTALDALAALQDGTLEIEDRTVTLTGTGAAEQIESAQAALGSLPDAATVNASLDLIEESVPQEEAVENTIFSLEVDTNGTAVTGTLPEGFDQDSVAAITGSGATDGLDTSDVEDPEWMALAADSLDALGALQSGTLSIYDRTVVLTGTGTRAQIAAAEDALADLPSANAVLEIFDDGAPLSLTVNTTEDTAIFEGKLPDGFDDGQLVVGDRASEISDTLTRAEITDDTNFAATAQAGLTGLAALETGQLTVEADKIVLSGVATTPTERDAAIASLTSASVAVETDIETRDDGQPVAFAVTYNEENGALVEGKLPANFTVEDISTALNLDGLEGDPTSAAETEIPDLADRFGVIAEWLPQALDMSIRATETSFDVTGTLRAEADLDQITQAIEGADAAPDSLTLIAAEPAEPEPAPEPEIVEVAPEPEAEPEVEAEPEPEPAVAEVSVENCGVEVARALETTAIGFITGSAQLNEASANAIDALAPVLDQCIDQGGFRVEIVGHTDSLGSATDNQALSQRRAETVATELVARGVSSGALDSIGLGENEPVASNATPAGRALNRRTEIIFKQQ